MKTINKIAGFVLAAVCLIAASCSDAEYDPLRNKLYIAEAASFQSATKVALESGHDVQVNFTVRMGKMLNHDVSVKATFNQAALDAYNATNGTNYEIVPIQYTDFDPDNTEITIEAGEIGTLFSITVQNFDFQGKQYALPISLEKTGGTVGVDLSAVQSKYVFLLDRKLFVKTAVMNNNSNWLPFMIAPYKDGITTPTSMADCDQNWNVDLDGGWTFEYWWCASNFSANNRCPFQLNGIPGWSLYVRVGDANRPYNYYSVGSCGINTPADLVSNKWYHIAFVGSTTDPTVTLYIDGKVAGLGTHEAGSTNKVNFIFLACGFHNYAWSMAQARLWKVGLTQTQIQNNMEYEIDATNPSLIAYWKMDEGTGTIFYDSTPNAHHAVAQTNVIRKWRDDHAFTDVATY